MLEGIQGLAEGRPISGLRDALQLFSWFGTFVVFVGAGVLVLLGSEFRRRLLAFAAAGVAFEVVTLLQPNPLLSVALVVALGALLWPSARRALGEAAGLLQQLS